jgi:hypothetical protein
MAYDLLTKKQSSKSWALGCDVGAPLIVYDSDMMKELDDLRRDVDGLNDDFTAWFKGTSTNPEARNLWQRWMAFRDQVYGTYKTWTDTTLMLTRGGSVHSALGRRKFYDNVKDLQEQTLRWRKTFEAKTGQKATSPIASNPNNEKKEESGGFWKWLAIAGAGAVGGLIVAKKLGA